ncbi:ribonuclease HII, partial [Psychrobacter sp. UBA6739]
QGLQQSTLQIGVDEAGRGPLLGSVNVAAAILPKTWSGLIEMQPLKDTPLSILTDSKQLSEKKRDRLYPLVQQHAIGYVVAEIPAAVIDQVNILQATMLGMRLCTEVLLKAIAHPLVNSMRQVEVLFDGNRCPELNESMLAELGIEKSTIDCQAWVKGDARHTSIAAASILAKVSRDKAMYALDAEHPEYGIAKHKGYPTRAHMEAIEKYGVLSAHRRSFAPVRKSLEKAT